jgi:hypothetical protein
MGRNTRVGSVAPCCAHRDRQQGEGRRIQHQEQDLRIAGRVGARVERLQLAHRAQADGRGGVVQAQHVRGEIQRDEADRRMAARHLGHEAREQRPQRPGEQVHEARALGDAQEAQPQGERAEEEDHHFDREARHVEQRRHHRREHAGIAQPQPAHGRRDGGNEEETEPEAVEHRGRGGSSDAAACLSFAPLARLARPAARPPSRKCP